MTMLGTGIMMNLLFVVACLPVVTIGQAWHGLLSAVRYQIRGDNWFDGFKHGFKTRFWRGTISWTLMLVADMLVLIDIKTHLDQGTGIVPVTASCVMFALATMVTLSLIILNVYVPTDVNNWVRNAVNMVFKAPHWLLLAAAVMWLPMLIYTFYKDIFILTVMIYVAAYYALAALVITLVLKDLLVEFLTQARADGTLTAEEGKLQQLDEEDFDDEEEE